MRSNHPTIIRCSGPNHPIRGSSFATNRRLGLTDAAGHPATIIWKRQPKRPNCQISAAPMVANCGEFAAIESHAPLEQLLVLANIETMNAEFIHMALPQSDRIKRLNAIAIRQMRTLTARNLKQLEGGEP